MSELSTMKNIGGEIARKITSIGIESAEQLCDVGSKQAFLRLKIAYPQVCLVHLYAIQAAIDGVEINQLPEFVKSELKAFNDSL